MACVCVVVLVPGLCLDCAEPAVELQPTGTFPMQSERFYQALKGHGGTARLVLLPHESHGYAARESIMHTLWEMDRWMGTYIGGDSGEPAAAD